MLGKITAGAMACALIMSVGCTPPKPMTPEEQRFQNNKQDCVNQTVDMMGGSPPEVFNNLNMTSYFQWCMENKGYSQREVNKIWYD